MSLISILWITCGALALVLAADALLGRYILRKRTSGIPTRRVVQHGSLLFAVAIGCIILGIYEATR